MEAELSKSGAVLILRSFPGERPVRVASSVTSMSRLIAPDTRLLILARGRRGARAADGDAGGATLVSGEQQRVGGHPQLPTGC